MRKPPRGTLVCPQVVRRWAWWHLSCVLALALTCCAQRPEPRPDAGPPRDEPPPSPRGQPDGTVARLSSRAELALRGLRVEAVPGDFLLQGRTRVAALSAEGTLLDLGERGGTDELSSVEPTLFHALEPLGLRTRRVVAAPGGRVLYVEKDALAEPLRLHAWWYFEGDTLVLESAFSRTAPNAGPSLETRAYATGELVSWGNLPAFVGGAGFLSLAGGAHSGRFVGRVPSVGGPGYAFCDAEPRTYARFPQSLYPGYHAEPRPRGAVQLPPGEPGAQSERRTVYWASSIHSLGHAAMALPCLRRDGVVPFAAWPQAELRTLPPASVLEARTCGTEPPLLRFSLDAPIELPVGCLQVRLASPGHTPGPWLPAAQASRRALRGVAPARGLVRFEVTDEAGRPLPARVFAQGLGATADPDFGESDVPLATQHAVYLPPGGAVHPYPLGRYRLTLERGFEYERHEEEVQVRSEATVTVKARLRRVVDTRGFLAADLHLHAAPSSDAPMSLEDRVRSLAAVGVEVGVATDHNQVTDYAPAIRAAGLEDFVASVVGEEVTTNGHRLGHWNIFPVAPDSEPLRYKDTTIPAMLATARARKPFGPLTLVQLNHPRMRELGYFELLRFDSGDPRGWAARTPNASLAFDAIEVWNGDDYAEPARVQECLEDFFALIAAGVRVTATGNSDSHKLAYHEAGYPRTYVAAADDSPRAFDERAFIAAVRDGRALVSGGPFIRLEVDGRGIGARVKPGNAVIHVRVEAPSWIDVSEVRLLRRGRPWKTWAGPFPAATVRLDETFRAPLERGDWLVVVAQGRTPITASHRKNAIPYSFTNPLYVD